MSKIRVLIVSSDRTALVAELIAEVVRVQADMKLVGKATGNMSVLRKLTRRRKGRRRLTRNVRSRNSRADVVIVPLAEGDAGRPPGLCSHLLAEFPDLMVLTLSVAGVGTIYRREVSAVPLPVGPAVQLVRAIHRIDDGGVLE